MEGRETTGLQVRLGAEGKWSRNRDAIGRDHPGEHNFARRFETIPRPRA